MSGEHMAEQRVADLAAELGRTKELLKSAREISDQRAAEIARLRELARDLIDDLHRHETEGGLACDSWCEIDRNLQAKAVQILPEDGR